MNHHLRKKIISHSSHVDLLRDMSLLVSKDDKQLAFKLISMAHEERSSGPAIRKIRQQLIDDLYIKGGIKDKFYYLDCPGGEVLDGGDVFGLLPGLGFFDSSPVGSLKINVNRKVSSLKVYVASPHQTYLNLRYVKIFAGKGKKLVSGKGCREFYSSSRNGKFGSLLLGEGHHSVKEKQPYYLVEFDDPIYVQSIDIGNREDFQGKRSQYLIVETEDERGVNRIDYATLSQENVGGILSEISAFLGSDDFVRCWHACNDEGLSNFVLLESLAYKLSSEYLDISDFTWFCILQCLDVWGEPGEKGLSEVSGLIISFYVARLYLKGHKKLPKSFEKLLKKKSDICRLEAHVNSHVFERTGKEVMLTKHGLAGKGKLVNDVEKCLTSLRQVLSHIESLGFQPLLAYGTLLGAVRENAFLAHDDDIDIIVIGNAETQDEAKREMEVLESHFTSLPGYRVGQGVEKNLNRHVVNKQLGVMIDVFPVWRSEGRLFLHMEKMKIRDIDASIVDEVVDCCLYGESFSAPGDWKQFLIERYGKGWETPDKFHEWPWELEG